jgi:hypothetical protein
MDNPSINRIPKITPDVSAPDGKPTNEQQPPAPTHNGRQLTRLEAYILEHGDHRPLRQKLTSFDTNGPAVLVCLALLAIGGLIALFCWVNGAL